MPVAPFVATGTACGRLRSPACAQRSLLPPSPHPPPNALYAGGWTPRYDAGQPPLPVPRQKWPRQARLSDKEACAQNKNAEGTLPSAFLFYTGHPFKGTLRTHGTPYAPKTGRGRHNAFLFLFSRSTGRCPLPTVQRRGPAAPPKKSFLEGGAGENLLSTKGFPRSNPPYYQLIAVQRHCCPCRSCRRAG